MKKGNLPGCQPTKSPSPLLLLLLFFFGTKGNERMEKEILQKIKTKNYNTNKTDKLQQQ